MIEGLFHTLYSSSEQTPPPIQHIAYNYGEVNNGTLNTTYWTAKNSKPPTTAMINLFGLSDEDISQMIQNDNVHILVVRRRIVVTN